jgi:hypothetical protein
MLGEAGLEGDRLVEAAVYRATVLARLAAETDRAMIEARIGRLLAVRHELAAHRDRVQAGYASVVELLARVSERLAAAAASAAWPEPGPNREPGRRTIEMRLAQTREVTLRLRTDHPEGYDPAR